LIIGVGSIFMMDLGAGPHHSEPVTQQQTAPSEKLTLVSAEFVSAKARSDALTPTKLLHHMQVDPAIDMAGLVAYVVGTFDETPKGKVLESYLIWEIGARKSDEYLDSLLNSAASKGHFWISDGLLTLSGLLDTASLMIAVILAANQSLPFAPSLSAPAASFAAFRYSGWVVLGVLWSSVGSYANSKCKYRCSPSGRRECRADC
jgi:hypothetical protein